LRAAGGISGLSISKEFQRATADPRNGITHGDDSAFGQIGKPRISDCNARSPLQRPQRSTGFDSNSARNHEVVPE